MRGSAMLVLIVVGVLVMVGLGSEYYLKQQNLSNSVYSTPTPEIVSEVTVAVERSIEEQAKIKVSSATGISADQIKIVSIQELMWRSGALGCAKPGEFYTTAVIPGYRIAAEAEGKTYHIHARKDGYMVICDRPTQ